MSDLTDFWGEPISTYTRAQAIEDGVLVDLAVFTASGHSAVALAGFRFPVAITGTALHAVCGCAPEDNPDAFARVYALLAIMKVAIRNSVDGDRIDFTVPALFENGDTRQLALYALCGPGDHAEPVVTIMLPEED